MKINILSEMKLRGIRVVEGIDLTGQYYAKAYEPSGWMTLHLSFSGLLSYFKRIFIGFFN